MRLFTTEKVICLFFALVLSVPIGASIAAPCLAASKSKKAIKPQSKVPINTVGEQATRPLELEPIKIHLESRLNVSWRPMSTGKTNLCEIHWFYLCNGQYSDPTVWRSSGDKNYDMAAKNTVDQSGPFAPFEGIEKLECVATFKTEAKGADVAVRFPGYQGTDSKVDREIAAKRVQDLNTIKIMKQRIVAAQKVLGTDSPKLTQSINFLANTYKTVNDYSSAEAAFKWAIAIREKANGPNSKELAESLSDLGEMYRVKGDFVSAEDCFKRVINMPGLKPCVELREAIHRYATLCMYAKRKSDADFLFQRVIDMQAGKPLAPLPANMTLDASASQEAPAKDSVGSDTKGGAKPAASTDKAAGSNDKAAGSADKSAGNTDKASGSSGKPADTTIKPNETKADTTAGDPKKGTAPGKSTPEAK